MRKPMVVNMSIALVCGLIFGWVSGTEYASRPAEKKSTAPTGGIVTEALRLKADYETIGLDITRLAQKLDVECFDNISPEACASTLRILDRNPELSAKIAQLRQAGIPVYITMGCGTLGCPESGGYLNERGTVLLYDASEDALKSFLLDTSIKKK